MAAAGGEKLDPGEVEVSTPVYHPVAGAHGEAETWNFGFSWSGVPVGRVTIRSNELRGEDGIRSLEVSAEGTTNAVVDLLWRYRMTARGSIRLDPFHPGEFFSEEFENQRHKITKIKFGSGRASSERRKGERVERFDFEATNMLDILSTVFLVLNMDYLAGDEYYFDVFTGTSRYLVTVEVEGIETVKAAGSEQEAYRLRIDSESLTDPGDDEKHRETHLWVSASHPRRLLRARARTFVGAIHIVLE